ncbi:hypothetical protein ZWY2020_026121 [Hordeum vulgare]|nr:hypothetical protein ZWY2020_026121 [Hordeum vulgare]
MPSRRRSPASTWSGCRSSPGRRSPTSFTSGRLAVLGTTTQPPPGCRRQRRLQAVEHHALPVLGARLRHPVPAATFTTPGQAGWTLSWLRRPGRGPRRATNSVEKPVKMPVAPVSWKLVKRPGVWPLEVSPRKSTTSSAESPRRCATR